MNIPICVVDAKTLVDHIQDIKRWIYNGRLCLVVPSSTLEHVEQLYQTSIEIKPPPQEPSRPRSFGRPPKREYPAFDLNPRLARTFLTRLKSWKEEDVASEQRSFLQEKEHHDAVEFQQPAEQYTPWKDLEIEEQKPEPLLDRPTTWADALRRKQNLANGVSEKAQMVKGPVKPKLVAKTSGSETSPWKIKNDAPKISVRDVPGALRPLMSCALWHLHESIHRNDANQLFLLSNQPELCSVAGKLNIAVRSTQELAYSLASEADRSEVEHFGDLEREFGVEHRTVTSPNTNLTVEDRRGDHTEKDNDEITKGDTKMNESMSTEGTARTDESQVIDEYSHTTLAAEDEGSFTKEVKDTKLSLVVTDDAEGLKVQDGLMASTVTLVEEIARENLQRSPRRADITVKADAGDMEKSSEAVLLSVGVQSSAISRANSRSAIEFEGRKAAEPSLHSVSASSLSSQKDVEKEPESHPPQENLQRVKPSLVEAAISTPQSASQTIQEPEDSDEEEIVFKPKRYSAQKQPVQQSPRLSTPKIQPQQNSENQSPQASKQKPQPQPKPSNRGRNTMVVSHGHPQPKSSPTVIDPDAFGRNFVVNPNRNPRTPHHPRTHHFPRSKAHKVQAPRSPRRQDARMSPPRNPIQEDPQRLSPPPGAKFERAPRTSPQRRSRANEAETTGSRNVGSARSPGAQSQLESPVPAPFEVDDFVPRSPVTREQLPGTGSREATNGSRAASFGPRSQMPQAPSSNSASTPKNFDSSEFVPRSSMTAPMYKPKLPESDYIEPRSSLPDVEYVLKSGSTRASARGRGRLWTPS